MGILGWLRRKAEEYGRSGAWARVRAEHLRREPRCRVCGSSKDLEVHHILPYAQDPSLELLSSNLISCCHDCHFCVAHAGNWKTYRPDVARLADVIRAAEVRRIAPQADRE